MSSRAAADASPQPPAELSGRPSGPLPSGPLPSGSLPSGPLPSGPLPPGPLRKPPPGWLIRVVLSLRSALLRVANALVPAEVVAFERATGLAYTISLSAFARGGYAEVFDDGPISAHAVAARLGRDPDTTLRFLHLLGSAGLLTVHKDGRFSHGRVSKVMRKDHPSRAAHFAQYFGSASNVHAWLDLDETLRTGKNAFERVHGQSVWDWFAVHPEERECFAQAMMGMTLATAPFITGSYPFAEAATVCDVGGGRGTLLSEILLRNLHLRGILVDAPGVLDSARGLLQHRGLLERVTLSPGSFFESVPSGADVYTLKNILHDWDDARSLQILRTVRAAMVPGQRVVVIEGLIDRQRPDPLYSPADMQMMVVCCEGRERTLKEYHALLLQAGFTPARSWVLPLVGLVEGVAHA